MRAYGELLARKGVARIVAAQLVARFPTGMLSILLLLHVQQSTGSYAVAGLVLAALSVGEAVGGPATSRLMARLGVRAVIAITLVACAASLAVIAFIPLATPLALLLGLVCGLSMPPVQPAVRTIYPSLVEERQVSTLFALDAAAQEIIFIAGPLLATLLALGAGTTVGLAVTAGILVAGTAWFVFSPEVGRAVIAPSGRIFGAVLGKPVVLISVATSLLLIGACAAAEVGVVAAYGTSGPQAGIILAVFGVGSLVGGLAIGVVAVTPGSLARRMLFVLAGMVLGVFGLEAWWLAVSLFVAGAGIAPAYAAMSAIVSARVPAAQQPESFAWLGTGQLLGAAIGSAVAGFLIEAAGPTGGFWAAIAFAVVGVLIPLLARGALPDLRTTTASEERIAEA